LLELASVRDPAIVLLLVDTGLRVSEAAGIRLGDLRPDGSVIPRSSRGATLSGSTGDPKVFDRFTDPFQMSFSDQHLLRGPPER
jgi:integrase